MFQRSLKTLSRNTAALGFAASITALANLTACHRNSGGGDNTAAPASAPAPTQTSNPTPPSPSAKSVTASGEPIMPEQGKWWHTLFLANDQYIVYQDEKTGYTVIAPVEIYAEIILTNINPQIVTLAAYAGSTWTEKCRAYRNDIQPMVNLWREAKTPEEKKAFGELIQNRVRDGAKTMGKMSARIQTQDDSYVRALLLAYPVDLRVPATFVRAARRNDIRHDVLAGRARSSETFVALADTYKEENFGKFIFSDVDATTNEFCDILLEQDTYYVNLAPHELSSHRLKIREGAGGVHPN